ncbi:retrovirus-related pol polyprotein LINE-1 [Tanacetum coccineum]
MRVMIGIPRILWKNQNGDAVESFKARVVEGFSARVGDLTIYDADQMWNSLSHIIEDAVKDSFGVYSGTTRSGRPAGNLGGFVRRDMNKAVAKAKDKAYECMYKKLDSIEGVNDIYKIAKVREKRIRDVGNIKYIKDEEGRSIVNKEDITKRSEGGIKEDGKKQSSMAGPNTYGSLEVPRRRGDKVIDLPLHQDLPKNYRGIKLLSHIMKLWERIIERRLRREMKVSENQFGFMPGRSTIEAIYLFISLMEKYREKQRDLHMAFLNIKKAYDSVPRELIWRTLIDKGTPRRFLRAIRDMYEGRRPAYRP